MPDKPLTVLTYAASASLAAVALVYFFNPNYLIDGEPSSSSASSRKKGVVGLFNPANDCFINCVLQSLAGLGDLRLFLIRETHRRELGAPEIYEATPSKNAEGKQINRQKMVSLQSGEVTKGLKEMIDRLNERPIYKKTISAGSFIRVLEHAFGTRIAKTQQDAQELLQIVAERLSEEYQAGLGARRRARELLQIPNGHAEDPRKRHDTEEAVEITPLDEDGFPLEGLTETRIECQFCHFIPKVTPTTFVMLTLSVPQKSSTSLSECFDSHFKTEYIDDYKCDRCRLVHACKSKESELLRSTEQQISLLESDILKLKKAIAEDPEKVPEGISLPDTKLAPKRKIGKYTEITRFPKILVIHLSRSIFDPHSSSVKNLSRVSFPEHFPVGSLLDRRSYKLLGVVCHKGTHNSGHYETFRRQHSYAPYSNPHQDISNGPYGQVSTPLPSSAPTPVISSAAPTAQSSSLKLPQTTSPRNSSASADSFSLSHKYTFSSPPSSTRPSSGSTEIASATTAADTLSPGKSSTATNGAPKSSFSTYRSTKSQPAEAARFRRKRKFTDRWWRISDEKVKECKTNEVLGTQREVYMLFYEVEKEESIR